jgi:hypothetical protein
LTAFTATSFTTTRITGARARLQSTRPRTDATIFVAFG